MITFTNIARAMVQAWELAADCDTKNVRANEIVKLCEDLVVDLEGQWVCPGSGWSSRRLQRYTSPVSNPAGCDTIAL
jgi:hypothetical protein